MKVKILSVEKTYDPYRPQGWTNDIHSWACKISIDGGGEMWAKVQTFTPKIEITSGAEFESDKNCGEIKREMKVNKQTGKEYIQITIKAPKREGGAYNGRGASAPKITMSEYSFKVQYAQEMAMKVAGPDAPKELVWSYFSAILKGMDHVHAGPPVSEKTADKVKDAVQGTDAPAEKNPFDDEQIPF